MRQPQRGRQIPRQNTSIVKTYPAPVGGWNARDALASMHPADAVVLRNWFPKASYVEFRGGSASHATQLTTGGRTLMVYNKLNGGNQMFCTTSGEVSDVSNPGVVGVPVATRTNAKSQWTMFGDGTSNWLIAVNGTDKPLYYDGTTWTEVTHITSPALTGYTGNLVEQFIGVNVFKGRLFFIPKDSLAFWYLAAGAAGGGLTRFDLSGEAPKGGYLMAMASWTRDAGNGPDDFAAFFTSQGEVIIYQGTNPSAAATWAKVGSYTIAKPLGRRCVIQYGGDCLVITEQGIFPLTALLQSGDERAKFALSYKIEPAFVEAARLYGANFGWRAIVYPGRDALLVNVPFGEAGVHEQYVMNTLTKSWTKFDGWEAEDFAVFNGELYFCINNAVYKAWTGTDDGGDNIVYYGKQAFQDFHDSQQKLVKLFMPILQVTGNVSYGADIDVDFADNEISGTVSYAVTSGAQWDSSVWDGASWAASFELVRQWSSPSDWQGRWISTKLQITSLSLSCQWMGSVIHYDHGDGI